MKPPEINRLIKLTRKSNNIVFDANSLTGSFHINDENDAIFLADSLNNELFTIEIDEDKFADSASDFSSNKTYSFTLSLEPKHNNRVFFTLQHFLKSFSESPKDIEINEVCIIPFIEEFECPEFKYSEKTVQYVNLIKALTDSYYFGKYPHQIVLFTNSAFPINLKPEASQEILNAFDKVDGSFVKNVSSFLTFFLGKNDIHTKEKKSVTAYEIQESLKNYDENIRINKFIERFSIIEESIEKSYDLYLKKFSFQNLLEQFEEKYSGFISSIDKSVKALQGQVLGLPVVAALSTLDKVADKPFTYIFLIAYCCFLSLNVLNQKKNLEYLKLSTDKLNDNVINVPDKFKQVSENERKILKSRINLLSRYIVYIFMFILSVTGYSFYKLYVLQGLLSL